MFKVLDLFCGAGGMSIGAIESGANEVFGVDLCRDSLRSYERNTSLPAYRSVRSRHLRLDLIKESCQFSKIYFDLLVGGPPCQPFSNAGKGLGQLDERQGLNAFSHWVDVFKPKAFVMENVPGLLSSRHVSIVSSWLINRFGVNRLSCTKLESLAKGPGAELRGVRYQIYCKTLQCADYGVPQTRRRVFFVGVSNEFKGFQYEWPASTHKDSRDREPLFSAHDQLPDWVPVSHVVDRLGPMNKERARRYAYGHNFRPGARIYKGHTGSSFTHPAKTIKAGVNGFPGGENCFRTRNGRIRYFTLAELSLLQGFPESAHFEGSFSSIAKQIGNAVPPVMVRLITSNLVRVLI